MITGIGRERGLVPIGNLRNVISFLGFEWRSGAGTLLLSDLSIVVEIVEGILDVFRSIVMIILAELCD